VGLSSRRAPILVLLLALCCGGSVCQTSPAAQTAAVAPAQAGTKPTVPAVPAKATEATAKKPAKPKLTARQKQAIDILQSVEGELGRYSPEMQAYLLQEMARAYQQLDRAKQVELLKEAFQGAANMAEGQYRTEQQNSIVQELDTADPSALVGIQYSPDPKVRATVLRLLVKDDIDHNHLQAAAARLSQWDTALEFPYAEAKRLISKLSAQQAGERQSVFSSAVAAYRNSDVEAGPENPMANLIVEDDSLLPVAMVVDAVDLVLAKAAKQDESWKDQRMSLTVGGKNGQASFDSIYDFELFELLPVLDKLDQAKADALRRDHANIAALTKKYPNGPSSLIPGSSSLSVMMSVSDRGSAPLPDPMTQQMHTAQAIEQLAERDPASAIASAQNLDNTTEWEYAAMTMRCRVLEKIAREAVRRKDYATAHTAMQALIGATQDLPALTQAHYLARAAALSAEMGETQAANQYISKGMKAAEGVYQQDAFADPPNDACKALWPSAAAWKALSIISARLDPGHALEVSASLPDPEIEAVANVGIAGVLLDQEAGPAMMSVSHNGKQLMKMTFDIPWSSIPRGGSGQEKVAAP
jgi:hypothetical protein